MGASVPQAASLTREQVKLKHALTGRKRAHDDDEVGGARGDDDDDERPVATLAAIRNVGF